jgi:hypothetical protein
MASLSVYIYGPGDAHGTATPRADRHGRKYSASGAFPRIHKTYLLKFMRCAQLAAGLALDEQ